MSDSELYDLGLQLANKGDYSGAIELFERAERIDEHFAHIMWIQRCLFCMGRFDEIDVSVERKPYEAIVKLHLSALVLRGDQGAAQQLIESEREFFATKRQASLVYSFVSLGLLPEVQLPASRNEQEIRIMSKMISDKDWLLLLKRFSRTL